MNLEFKENLRGYQDLINARLRYLLESREPANLYEPIKYVLESGGKRIRPILVILACEVFEGDVEAALDAAVAMELLHNFTLVHDDIMDQDDTRRGLPTVHKKWDTHIALLAGDGLVSLAYQALFQTKSPRLHEIARVFTDGIIELCEGQALDYDFERRKDVKLGEYLGMISKKTARLLNISTRIGAMIGNGSDREVEILGDFGHNLGCAFQIQDDLLDITADEEILGKTFGSDIMRRKQTYLLVHAMTHADPETKILLTQTLYKSNNYRSRINEIRDLFMKIGSIEAAKSAINGYLSSAKKNLHGLPSTPGKANLSNLLGFIATRKA